jgi:hypothetical protein
LTAHTAEFIYILAPYDTGVIIAEGNYGNISASLLISSNSLSAVALKTISLTLGIDEILKKDVGQDSRFFAMGVSCGQAP